MRSTASTTLSLAMLPLAAWAQNSSLPVVDLGKTPGNKLQRETRILKALVVWVDCHSLTLRQQDNGAYNFSNIRFALPPVGDLRFREPVPVWKGQNSTQVNNGSDGRVCPQAGPLWQLITAGFVESLTQDMPFNQSIVSDAVYGNQSVLEAAASKDPRQNEDCLFLDVVVPQSIYNNGNSSYGAPVLLWIFGGGYTEGEKTDGGLTDPTGLFAAAQKATGEQFIWVTINYRLGAFGWLAGPTLSGDGTPNAALYDQRLAIEWVGKYIHLFGGDPDRITLMGESAGGGSIMHQITAFNGQRGTPFAQAIPQSPGWFPVVSSYQQEETFDQFLQLANVSSLDELRNASTETLQMANYLQVANSQYGEFSYGPVVDGVFAPQLPGRAFLSGNFDPNLRLLLGHNEDEGFLFSSPNITTNDAFRQFIVSRFTGVENSVVDYIANDLYPQPANDTTVSNLTNLLFPPAVTNSSHGYVDNFERTTRLVGEAVFTCNTYYMAKAFGNRTHNYQFSVLPAFHGQDVNYTFAKDPIMAPVPAVASALQQYISTFVVNGVPSNVNNPLVPQFPIYGDNATLVNLDTSFSYIPDPNASPRCDFWQKALYA